MEFKGHGKLWIDLDKIILRGYFSFYINSILEFNVCILVLQYRLYE